MKKDFKDLTFTKVFLIWFAAYFFLLMLNNATVKSGLLASIVGASLGVFLLIVPIPPVFFQRRYGPRAPTVTRIMAVVIIVVAFLTKIKF